MWAQGISANLPRIPRAFARSVGDSSSGRSDLHTRNLSPMLQPRPARHRQGQCLPHPCSGAAERICGRGRKEVARDKILALGRQTSRIPSIDGDSTLNHSLPNANGPRISTPFSSTLTHKCASSISRDGSGVGVGRDVESGVVWAKYLGVGDGIGVASLCGCRMWCRRRPSRHRGRCRRRDGRGTGCECQWRLQ